MRHVDLLPHGKTDKWVVIYMEENGCITRFFDDRGEVYVELLSLDKSGYDMKNVIVYPPQSNCTYREYSLCTL